MKKLVLLSFSILFAFIVNAQNELPINDKTGKVTFLEVISADGLSAKQLYKIMKDYATEKGFSSVEDVDGAKLVYNATAIVYYPSAQGGGKTDKGIVHYTYSGFFKDGKYRVILTDFVHEGEGKLPDGGKLEAVTAECGKIKMTARGWVTVKNKTRENMEELIADTKRVIKEVQNDPANNDDW